MKGIPDALFIIDVGYENIAVKEAIKLGIPVIGIVDSNNSPKNIDYVIPGNDDAIRSISLYAKGMADAIIEGRSSMAYLDDTNDKDELVEIDDSGELVKTKKGETVKVTKKKAKKKIIKAAESTVETDKDKTAELIVEADKDKAAVTKKKVTKKKVTKKKVKLKIF